MIMSESVGRPTHFKTGGCRPETTQQKTELLKWLPMHLMGSSAPVPGHWLLLPLRQEGLTTFLSVSLWMPRLLLPPCQIQSFQWIQRGHLWQEDFLFLSFLPLLSSLFSLRCKHAVCQLCARHYIRHFEY